MTLKKLLDELKIPYSKYIKLVKLKLANENLDPMKLKIADDGKHKFEYDGVKFGSVINNDFLIYTILEDRGDLDVGTAQQKRKAYRARAKMIYEKSNKLSPSWLSFNILW